jgi:hypothetical protein
MPEENTESQATEEAQSSATDESVEELGENGVKALRAEREARKQLEAKLKELEPAAQRLKELEDAQKSEQEKLAEKLSATEQRAAEAELRAARLEVATSKGLPMASVKFLTGSTPDELAASADELLGLLKKDEPEPSGRPKERLKGGASPADTEPGPDPNELADSILSRQF